MADDTKPKSSFLGGADVFLKLVAVVGAGALIAFFRDDSEGDSKPTGESAGDTSSLRPTEALHGKYSGSASCRECHSHQHETWHASYHRTMTQVANPENVIGDFNDVRLRFPGQDGFKEFRLRQVGSQYWAEFDSPGDVGRSGARTTLPVVMTTGSHHMQAYWLALGNRRTIGLLPLVYLKDDQRWVPRRAAFLQPPTRDFSLEIGRWDKTCINCHTTGGQPSEVVRNGLPAFDSSAAEFGISCEACHGAAAEHVRLRRAERSGGKFPGADPIVNPAALSPELSAQVCGGCHSITERIDGYHVHQPGTPLDPEKLLHFGLNEKTRRHVMQFYDHLTDDATLTNTAELHLRGMFWGDGQPRIVGREYTALLKSTGHDSGQLSCLSCHQMHQEGSDGRKRNEWADDQLGVGMRGNRACTQCHADERFAGTEHSHHASGSPGAQCLNCHMPHTAYGLLKAMRNHSISSPNLVRDREAGRPNACNLCHLDRTEAWTASHLKDWYGQGEPMLDPEANEFAAGVRWSLQGDASVRALTAWHLGWAPATSAMESTEWIAPLLGGLMDDPYDAVRYIAHKSLRQMSQYRNLEYDFVAAGDQRLPIIGRLMREWSARPTPELTDRSDLLIDSAGKLDVERLTELLRQRDDSPLHLLE